MQGNNIFSYIHLSVSNSVNWLFSRRNFIKVFGIIVLYNAVIQILIFSVQAISNTGVTVTLDSLDNPTFWGLAFLSFVLLVLSLLMYSILNGFYIKFVEMRFLDRKDFPKIATKNNIKLGLKFFFQTVLAYVFLYIVVAFFPLSFQTQIHSLFASIAEILIMLNLGFADQLKKTKSSFKDLINTKKDQFILPIVLFIGINILTGMLGTEIIYSAVLQILIIPFFYLLIITLAAKK